MAAYFGACDAAGVASGDYYNADYGFLFWHAYTCPGTGTQHLSRLEMDCHVSSGTAYGRVGIYDSTGSTLLAETSLLALTNTVDEWIGSDVSVDLVGGTDYILAWNSCTAVLISDHVDDTRTLGDYHYGTDYTEGLPAALPTVLGSYPMYPLRALVSDAADSNFFFYPYF